MKPSISIPTGKPIRFAVRGLWIGLAVTVSIALSGCLHTPGALSALQITSTRVPTRSTTPLTPAILLPPTTIPIINTSTAAANLPQIDITIPASNVTSTVAVLTGTPAPVLIGVQYVATLAIAWGTHRVNGKLITTYRNQTDGARNEVVFRVTSAERPNAFSLSDCYTDDPYDRCVQTGSQITVQLEQPLAIGKSVAITMIFAVQVPPMPGGAFAKNGYFGYSARQMNLGDWLPAVAPYYDGQWIVPQPWPIVGETTVTEAADYEVTATLAEAAPGTATATPTLAPAATAAATLATIAHQLTIAGPGEVDQPKPNTWHFRLSHARNFALSIGDFAVTRAVSANGVTIELYAFPHTAILSPAIDQALHTAQTAIVTYDRLFATPFPYTRLAIIEGDFADGMEFSGVVFIGAAWFMAYDGKPDSWVTLLTAHELAHQWWYSLVGDDQSQHPMLDEALATYSESLYIEQNYPALDAWWWSFRVDFYKPTGSVDASVYAFNGERPYIDAVYLRGSEMLRAIRQVIGDDAFFGWLRTYAHTQADRIATPATFWNTFSATEYASLRPIRHLYLHDPDPLFLDPIGTLVSTTPMHIRGG